MLDCITIDQSFHFHEHLMTRFRQLPKTCHDDGMLSGKTLKSSRLGPTEKAVQCRTAPA